MRRIPRWLIVVLVIAALAAALRWLVFPAKPVPVVVARVERGVVEEAVTNTRAGTVKARTRARLSPQMGGLVVSLPFREGDLATAGALLIKLDDSLQQAQLRLAEEDVRAATARAEEACLAQDLALREWERGRALEADGITSEQLLDNLKSTWERARATCRAAQSAISQAQARVGAVRAEIALTEVRAPFRGVVADLGTEVGEWVTPAPPGVPIPPVLDLLDAASLYVSAPIDEVDAGRVRVSQEVRITIDSRPGERFTGRLVRVASFVLDVLEQNRTVEVEAEPDRPAEIADVLPGTSADVEVILNRRENVLRIPAAAVAEGDKVLVLVADRLEERAIELGMRNWQFVEVAAGLVEGEEVVTVRDSTDIKPGARAVVAERP